MYFLMTGGTPDIHQLLSLPLFNRADGQNKMEKFEEQDKDGEIAYHLQPRAKQNKLGREKVLVGRVL